MNVLMPIFLILLSSMVFAESTLPVGCEAIAVQGQVVTLQAKKNKMVFIHNLSKGDLWMTHPVVDSGASAGWTSRLQSGNWSALVLDKGPFAIHCVESVPGHEQQIPCEGAIAVCQWKKMKFPANGQGVFWAGEDMSLSALTAAIGGKGFVLSVAN